MKLKTSKKLMLIATVSLLTSTMVVYAATTLFTQTFPGQTFNSVASLTEGTCGNSLVLDTSASTIPSAAGQAATLVYACDTSGGAAFNSNGAPQSVTPSFTQLPAGWTLTIDETSDTSLCGTSAAALTSGTPFTPTSPNSFVYCLTTSTASTFTSFSITWSQ